RTTVVIFDKIYLNLGLF
ncbi:hypothetical protein GWI33_001054, partial [Rhynchophorus ferrugineus]